GDSQANPGHDNQLEEKALSVPAASQSSVQDVSTLEAAPALHEAEGVEAQPVIAGELIRRRVSTPIPTTNLGALRALANETARLAISRHELRTLRRNAKTKTIVATLAGVTSVWLMLDATDWRSLQFIAACGSLLVAAYWAGEAFRTWRAWTR